MSKVSAFSYDNTTASSHTIAPIALGLTSNYALTGETAHSALLSNTTADVDSEEIISVRSRMIDKVDTDLTIQNPARVKKGIQYQITVNDTLVTTDTDDPSYRVDEPIVVSLIVRHGRSGNITGNVVAQVFKRLCGCVVKSDGTYRFDDWMRGAERPITD